MKLLFILVLLLVLALLGYELFVLYGQRTQVAGRLGDLTAQVERLKKENGYLRDDVAYFSNKENLMKELRGLFNFKKIGEKLLIVVEGN